jgi:hypothetical protein
MFNEIIGGKACVSVRIKVAIGLGLLGIFSLIGSADFKPIGWRDWLIVGWVFGKIGFLVYAAYLLIIADEEIDTWKSRNESSERLIQEIIKQSNSPTTS